MGKKATASKAVKAPTTSTPKDSTQENKNTEVLVKLQIRSGSNDWAIHGDNGEVYRPVDGVIEVPAALAERLDGDPDYTVVG